MTDDELRALEGAKVVDARGMACPGPLLEAKKSMADVPEGGVIEVLSSDEGTNMDIPMWARKMNYDFLGYLEEAGYWRLFVRKTT
jgi:tRNA 2-thiouridine synthesizing protein A